jgi:hypothetical protein
MKRLRNQLDVMENYFDFIHSCIKRFVKCLLQLKDTYKITPAICLRHPYVHHRGRYVFQIVLSIKVKLSLCSTN